jgi:hypothetical protein
MSTSIDLSIDPGLMSHLIDKLLHLLKTLFDRITVHKLLNEM